MVDGQMEESGVDIAMKGLRHLLQEEKTEKGTTVAVNYCQAIHHTVERLLQTVDRYKSRSSTGGSEAMQEISEQLSVCFSTSAAVLALCKEVESGSSWLFDTLSSYLASLFKTTFSLIKVSTELLEVVTFDSTTFDSVVSRLRLLCAPVLHFDPSLSVLVFRGVGRMVCRGKSVLSDEWSIQPIMSDICIAMETKALECVQCAPNEPEGCSDRGSDGSGGGSGYVKLLKLCRFLSSLLVKLVQEFHDSIAECSADLANLLVHLYGRVPPSPYSTPVSSNIQAELESNILIVCEPVIATLLDCTQFLNSLLSPTSPTSLGERGGRSFGRLMCLCVLLKNFPKLSEGLQDHVMEPISSRESQSESCTLLDAVFSTTSQCGVELQLPVRVPGVMCNGQPQRAVSLSEHLLVHLCTFISCLPQRHFTRVERVLFCQMFSEGDILNSLLAADVLTFIVKSAEHLADSYAHLLAQLAPLISCHVQWAACLVLRRVVSFLSPSHQSLFTQAHPPSSPSQLLLWAHLDLTVISKPLQTQVVQQLMATSIEFISAELPSEHPDLQSLHWAVKCLHSSLLLLPPSHHHPSTLTTITKLWEQISTQDPRSSKLGAVVLCDGVDVMASQLSHLPPQTLLKVFNSLRDLITRGTPISVCLAVAQFLTLCGSLKLPGNLQNPILHNVVFLFQHLFSHPHWLVIHYSLLAFRHFAKTTPYASVVEECIVPSVSDTVVDFLRDCPYLVSSRPEFSQHSFWVQELGQRETRVAEWQEREGEGDGEMETEQITGDRDTPHQTMVASKVQLLLDTWHELRTLRLSSDMCTQLHDLCTSMQSHISQYSSLSNHNGIL